MFCKTEVSKNNNKKINEKNKDRDKVRSVSKDLNPTTVIRCDLTAV